jgi:hypothetical protein
LSLEKLAINLCKSTFKYQGQKQKQKRTLRHLLLTSALIKVEKIKKTPVDALGVFSLY